MKLPDWRDAAALTLTGVGMLGLNGFALVSAYVAAWTLTHSDYLPLILVVAGFAALLVGAVVGLDLLVASFVSAGIAEQFAAEIAE